MVELEERVRPIHVDRSRTLVAESTHFFWALRAHSGAAPAPWGTCEKR